MVDYCDYVTQCKECSGRKYEDKHTELCRDDAKAEDGSVAEKFTGDAKKGEADGETESYSYSVKRRVEWVVLACE